MTGLWLQDGALRRADDLAVPDRPTGEALVRVAVAGICNTDLELMRGYYPFAGVLGHEFVGVVEAAPAGREDLEGRRVVGEINAVCGVCAACSAGRRNHCAARTVLGIVGRHGAFADYLTLPAENLHVVPDGVANESAVFVEPLAAALRIQEQVEIGAGDRVLVVGDGKLGQLIARTLALATDRLRVAGRHAAKLSLLAEGGLETILVDNGGAAVEGDHDIVVECTGSPAGFELARRAVRPGGTLVLKSTYAGHLTVDASNVVVDEITLIGSRCGSFAPALRLLESGRLRVDDLVAARYPMAQGVEAFEHARRAGTLKVLLHNG